MSKISTIHFSALLSLPLKDLPRPPPKVASVHSYNPITFPYFPHSSAHYLAFSCLLLAYLSADICLLFKCKLQHSKAGLPCPLIYPQHPRALALRRTQLIFNKMFTYDYGS